MTLPEHPNVSVAGAEHRFAADIQREPQRDSQSVCIRAEPPSVHRPLKSSHPVKGAGFSQLFLALR